MVNEIQAAFPAFYAFLEQEKSRGDDAYDVLPGATEETLQQLEADLHLELPVSYKRFLRCARGMALFEGYVHLEAQHPYFHDWSDRQPDHQGLLPPSHGMLCFASCWWLADGDAVLFDISQGLHEGEYPVMYYAHDDDLVIRRLANSFEEWIEQWLPTFGENESESLLRASSSSTLAKDELLRGEISPGLTLPKHLLRPIETPPETQTKKLSFWHALFKRG